jgi:hypothetical protein
MTTATAERVVVALRAKLAAEHAYRAALPATIDLNDAEALRRTREEYRAAQGVVAAEAALDAALDAHEAEAHQ